MPGADRPSGHVAFPLESGNLQVFLRPSVGDGALRLESPGGRFGEDGVRADHELRLWDASVVRLHYRLEWLT